ncbi:MAG: hypothetical protein ACLQVL_06000 [Terriglobia bacterium]
MKHRFTIVLPIVLLGALAFALPARAQRGVGAKPAPGGGRAASGGSWARGGSGAYRPAHPLYRSFRGRGRGYGSEWGVGWAYLPFPGDYYDYPDYEPGMTEPPRWESAAQYVPAEPPREIHPMLLERQGDHWVQVTGYAESATAMQPEPPQGGEQAHLHATVPSGSAVAEPPRELPTAVLVFRDGHQEEVRSYSIIGDALYAKADYWTNGSWTRRIEIANLDVPATLKLNDERGSKFRLPSGPQEVVIRP